jgi:hypothetical protein
MSFYFFFFFFFFLLLLLLLLFLFTAYLASGRWCRSARLDYTMARIARESSHSQRSSRMLRRKDKIMGLRHPPVREWCDEST